ncbi:MAG TPA: hypothetical protein PK765_07080 [bacterium]|nr:hypothetical protein [bacterium]
MSNEHNPLQREIETILLDTDSTVPERIALLKDLFEREKILLFTDFDDTVVDSSCVFFGRLTLLERLGKLDTPEEGKNIIDEVLMRYFAINPHFSRVLADGNFSGKMVVISRNYHALIRRFVLHAELYLSNTGYTNISIVGGIGQIPGIFTYRSRDKLAFLPK